MTAIIASKNIIEKGYNALHLIEVGWEIDQRFPGIITGNE
jgi:hypothetical protein